MPKAVPYEKSFAYLYPELAKEWHPTKNGKLKPSDVIASGSHVKAWWFLPYDDPVTGKHFDFEWYTSIGSRVIGCGCPYLSNPPKKVWPGFNDFETYCLNNGREDLLKEWHPTKNGKLTSSNTTFQSNKKIWWLLPYDDPVTGKHFDFEWRAAIDSRTRGNKCPFLSGKQVWPGFNDLETFCRLNDMEYLLKEWHPTKNGKLTPSNTTSQSNKKIWWLLPYDDPVTGKHFDFEWQARLCSRVTQKLSCPYLSNHALYPGFNDFETFCKYNGLENVLKEWHPTKNGKLKPSDVIASGSHVKAWWFLPYDDPVTGKHFDFEWYTSIGSRVIGCGCPYLSNPPKKVWPGFNDFETYCLNNGREDLLKEWHPTKNRGLKPSDITTTGENVKIWWFLPYDDPNTGKHFDFEWQSRIQGRIRGNKCPFLSGKQVWPGFNDFETYCLNNGREDLLKEWHPTKNGKLTPSNITAKNRKEIWWLLPYDDPVTGKHFDFEWKANPNNRTGVNNTGCPYLSGKKVWSGFNDFETYCLNNGFEYLLQQWHPTKNSLPPSKMASISSKKVWWLLPYDDPVTGKHFDFEWKSVLNTRLRGYDCPYLSNPPASVWPGFNDFETYCLNNGREDLLKEWHPTKNKKMSPKNTAPKSNKKIWWLCQNGHEWRANIINRVQEASPCPYCNR